MEGDRSVLLPAIDDVVLPRRPRARSMRDSVNFVSTSAATATARQC